MNSTLSLVARQHNHVHGALTLGAAAREGREFLRTLIVTAQTAGTLPLRADGTKSAVLDAAPVQPSAPSPFLMPPPAYTAPSAPLFSQMGFEVQGVDSLNLRDFRRVKAGGRGEGCEEASSHGAGCSELRPKRCSRECPRCWAWWARRWRKRCSSIPRGSHPTGKGCNNG